MLTTIYQAVEEKEKLQNRITKSERGSKIYRGLVKKPCGAIHLRQRRSQP